MWYPFRRPPPPIKRARISAPANPVPRQHAPLVDSPHDLPIGDRIKGEASKQEYALIGRIGGGGMGTVYRALNLDEDFEVAIKAMQRRHSEEGILVRRFRRELVTMTLVRSPHIVQALDHGKHEGVPFIVMEYVKGRRLLDIMNTEYISVRRAVALGLQICDALMPLHASGRVHRDLKPENILVTREAGRELVKLCDFGAVKILSMPTFVVPTPPTNNPEITADGLIIGTPRYLPPEHMNGRCDVTSDIYMVGMILYEMVSGTKLFNVEGGLPAIMRAKERDPPRIREVDPYIAIPREIESAIMNALTRNLDKRCKTIVELRHDLSSVHL